jgi:hypothetical protein
VKGCMLPHMLLSLFNDICAASLDAPFLNCASIFFFIYSPVYFFIDPMFAAFFLFSFILFYFKNGMFISKICLI